MVKFTYRGKDWEDIVKSDFHVPTLIFHDSQDKEIGIEHSKQICSMWPWATLISTEGLGHRSILDDDNVAEGMLKFIQTTPKEDAIIY